MPLQSDFLAALLLLDNRPEAHGVEFSTFPRFIGGELCRPKNILCSELRLVQEEIFFPLPPPPSTHPHGIQLLKLSFEIGFIHFS